MKNFIDFLTEQMPWLPSVLFWIIVILIGFLIFMAPAYFWLCPFFEPKRQKLDEYIRRLSELFGGKRREREQRLDKIADEFLGDNGLRRVKSEGKGYWLELNRKLIVVSTKLRQPIAMATQSLNELKEQIIGLKKQAEKYEIDKAQALPALPESGDELAEAVSALRIAWLKVILSGTILFALMLVNTGMLSQILRDLGVVPATMTFAGIPLSYVFAFILTLVEAGLGVAHGATREREPDKFFRLSTFMVVFAVILACVEGFFYSRVAPSSGLFTLPFINYELPQSNLFFLWGFVLVMTLFGLGSIGYEAAEIILHGTKSSTLRREIKKLLRIHERYNGAVEASRKNLNEAKKTISDIDKVLHGPADNSVSVREQLDFVLVELKKLSVETPEWAQDKEEKLTRTEVHQLAQTGGIWLTLALLGIVAVTMTGFSSLLAFNPGISPTILWILSVVLAAVFLGIGLLFGTKATLVQGEKGERRVWAWRPLARLASYVIGGLLVAAHFAVFFMMALPLGMGIVWFSNLVVGLFLIAAGYHLGPLLNIVFRLWFSQVGNWILNVGEAVRITLIRLVWVVFVILENISYLLAMPLVKRRERKELVQTQPSSV
jgi:hypothetical protein